MSSDPNRQNPSPACDEVQTETETVPAQEPEKKPAKKPAKKKAAKCGPAAQKPVPTAPKQTNPYLNARIEERSRVSGRIRQSASFYMRSDLLYAVDRFAKDGLTKGDVLEAIVQEYADNHPEFMEAVQEYND